MSRPARLFRLIRAAAMVLVIAAVAPLSLALPKAPRLALIRGLFRMMLAAFGVGLEVHGEPLVESGRGALVAINHVSWMDIVAMNAVRPMRAVAKKQIGQWPVVGWLATVAGTVYLDRERLRTLPNTVAEMANAMRNGATINFCPEGTTWCGLASGRFRPALFQSAIDGGVPVRTVVFRYRLTDGSITTWPAFVGDETFVDAARRVARLRGLVVEVHVLGEIAPGRAADRFELAALAETSARGVLDHNLDLDVETSLRHTVV
ncbi:MAG TPA: lysophospholipid acyltransferase family protein [Pseudonocardiaceae bacterium]|nr:lysophospholipid acyltransferase family protein [Pseudonocardiaceae bacterium]